MIGRLAGTLVRKALPAIIVDCGGVGYELKLSLATFETLPAEGQPVTLSVQTLFRSESLDLYAFAHDDEKGVFNLLLGVTGVGPKIALAVLSALPPRELARAVLDERWQQLERVPGIGRKTAQRLVLELKDKFKDWMPTPGAGAATGSPPVVGEAREDAIAALENLGYRRADAEKAVAAVRRERGEVPLAELLRAALRLIGERT